MKDLTLLKLCFTIFLIGILSLITLISFLDNPETGIVKKINSKNYYFNLTIETTAQKELFLTGFTKNPLNISEGDYISYKGTQKDTQIQATKITKLGITTKQ